MNQLGEAMAMLAGGDEAERIYAAEDIGYANQAAGVDALLARLPEEPSRAVREAIFAALLQIEDDAAMAGALGLLDSEDPFVRNQAVQLLQARGAGTLPSLERAFREGGRDRRKFVIDVLARVADPDAAGLYRQALLDSDLNIVITAVESLGNMREVRFREAVEALVSENAHPMLLGACLEALAQIGDTGSVDLVRARLGCGECLPPYLQPSYIKLVGMQGVPQDAVEIARFAEDAALDSAVLNALTALRSRCPEWAVPSALARPLQEMAERNQPALAYQALRLLGRLSGGQAPFDFLVRALDHPDKVIRIGAIQALRESAGEKAAAILRERLARETDEELLQAGGRGAAE